jgi:hypothetical protein
MKIITTIFAMVFATASYAQTVNVVNPGSEEGAFRQVLTAISEGTDYSFIQANNPVTAYTYLEQPNAVTMWSSEWPGDPELPSPAITEDNLIALMTSETLMCSREYSSFEEMAGNDVKIATWGSEPVAKFLTALSEEHGINFVVVPFDGSGTTTKGYVAGDADTVFTITSRQDAIKADNVTTCFAFSENDDLGFRFVDAIITVNADTALTDELRERVAKLSTQNEWLEMFTGTVTYVGGSREEYLEMFDSAVINFSK